MNILFIEKRLRADKLGICYLSKVLKDAGHNVDIIQDDIENIETYLIKNKIDFILWSVSSGEQNWVFEKNKILKRKFDFISIVGGPHFTYFPEQGEQDPHIDHIVQGPGENVILDIIERKNTKRVIKASIPQFDKFPDRSLIYKYDEFRQSPMKRFMASRYCKWNCSYCFNHVFRKLYSDEKDHIKQITSVNKIIEEIIDVRNKYGLELAYFNDDNLASNSDWLKSFCGAMKQIDMKFCGSVRVEDINEELIQLMGNSGCTFLNMALEAGNPETLKLLRRSESTFEKVKQMAQTAIKAGIKIRIQNMIGLPVDNILEDALYTLRCNQEINPTDSWVSVYQPYGKTDLAEYCVKKGFISTNYVAQGQYDRSQFNFPDSEVIYRLSKWWWFFIVHKIDIEFIKTIIQLPLTDDQMNMLQELF